MVIGPAIVSRMGTFATLVIVMSVAGPSQGAGLLKDAVRLRASLDMLGAQSKALEALKTGQLQHDEVAQAHRLMGELAAAMGDIATAEREFARLLTLRPDFEVAATESPRIREAVRVARERVGTVRLGVKVDSAPLGNVVATRVLVQGDAMGLVQRARLELRREGGTDFVEMARTDVFSARWSCTRACDYAVSLLDGFGNEVLSAGTEAAPLHVNVSPALGEPVEVPKVVVNEASEGRAWYASPIPWVVAAGVLTAVGGVFAWRMSADDAQLAAIAQDRARHSFSEVQTLDAARRRSQVVMFTGFGFAAASGVTAALVW